MICPIEIQKLRWGPKSQPQFSISTLSSQLSILTFETIDFFEFLHQGNVFLLRALGAQAFLDDLFPGVELVLVLERKRETISILVVVLKADSRGVEKIASRFKGNRRRKTRDVEGGAKINGAVVLQRLDDNHTLKLKAPG